MKKTLLGVFIFLIANTLIVHAQNKFQNGEYDVLIRIENQVFQIRDSNQIKLLDSRILDDGTMVNANGIFTSLSSKKHQLINGDCLDSNGVKYNNEYEYRRAVIHENEGLSPLQVKERNKKRYHLMFIKGEVFQIMNNILKQITSPVDLGYRRVVQPNGIHKTSYGYSRLKEGGCINMFGRPLINLYEHRKILIRKEKRAAKKELNKELL